MTYNEREKKIKSARNYKLVYQCAHRCRLNQQSVSFYHSGRGRVTAYEPNSKVKGGVYLSRTHSLSLSPTYTSQAFPRFALIVSPVRLPAASAVPPCAKRKKKKVIESSWSHRVPI